MKAMKLIQSFGVENSLDYAIIEREWLKTGTGNNE